MPLSLIKCANIQMLQVEISKNWQNLSKYCKRIYYQEKFQNEVVFTVRLGQLLEHIFHQILESIPC